MPTVQGREVQLPVEVREASSVLATWLVPAERAQRLIDASGLTVYGPVPGRALVSVGMIRYVDSDLDSYNEFALAVVIKREGVVATLIHQLPVDQAFTLEAGRSIWGFPKFMTTSTIEPAPGGGTVGELATPDGQRILTLEVKAGLVPLPSRELKLDTYSFTGGVLRRTPFSMRTSGAKLRPGGARLRIGSGHPMADDLWSLGLGQSVSSMHVAHMSATFGAAEVVEST